MVCLSLDDDVFVVILGSRAKEEESLCVCIHSKDNSIIAMKSIDLVRRRTLWHFLCLRRRRMDFESTAVLVDPSFSFMDIRMIPLFVVCSIRGAGLFVFKHQGMHNTHPRTYQKANQKFFIGRMSVKNFSRFFFRWSSRYFWLDRGNFGLGKNVTSTISFFTNLKFNLNFNSFYLQLVHHGCFGDWAR